MFSNIIPSPFVFGAIGINHKIGLRPKTDVKFLKQP